MIRRLPSAILGHFGLAWALDNQHKYAEVEAEAREMVRLRPDGWSRHATLGTALRHQGNLVEALVAYRRAQDLLRMPGTSTAAELAALIRCTERQPALAPRMPAILRGEDRPKDATEGIDLAGLFLDRDRPAAATRLFADALAADPGRADARDDPPVVWALRADIRNTDPPRYEAARAAALAGTGQGRDAPPPEDPARARLRGQALTYLRQERVAWARELDRGDPASAKRVRVALTRWQDDYDLNAVRRPEAMAALPEAERADWRAFWDEADALLQRAAKA